MTRLRPRLPAASLRRNHPPGHELRPKRQWPRRPRSCECGTHRLKHGGPGATRTHDLRTESPPLYRPSYRSSQPNSCVASVHRGAGYELHSSLRFPHLILTLDLRHPVADARLVEYVGGIVSVIRQLAPSVLHRGVNRPQVTGVSHAPDSLQRILAVQHPPGVDRKFRRAAGTRCPSIRRDGPRERLCARRSRSSAPRTDRVLTAQPIRGGNSTPKKHHKYGVVERCGRPRLTADVTYGVV